MALPVENVDVLIIGAGPAGYMLANALVHLGIRDVLIADKRDKGVQAGQADGIQPRTIEILQSYGLAQRLLAEANWMCMASMYNPDPETGGIRCTERLPDVNAPTARWPHELTLHQGGIEAIFRDAMKSKGIGIRFGTTVASMDVRVEEAAEWADIELRPVTAVLAKANDPAQQPTTEVRAKFAVGCDGAHSWTRRWMGHTMEGEQTDYIWGVMDGEPETDFPDWRCKSAVHSNSGSCMVLPRENNSLRLYIQMDSQSADRDGRIDRSTYKLEDIQDAAKNILKPYSIHFPKVDWWTIYVIGQRVASGFRSSDGRVFIAGDACHTHSPKAGQGANAAMGDAHNLAWKLASVLRGQARDPEALLATYEAERRTFAQELIAFDKVFAKLFSGKARSKDVPDGVTHEQFVSAFRTFGGFSSGIGINYMPKGGTCHNEKDRAAVGSKNLLVVRPSKEQQSLATEIEVGARIPTAIVVRAGDGRPYELHDVIPTNGAFRLLLWIGDVAKSSQLERAHLVSKTVAQVLQRYTPSGERWDSVVDVISIASAAVRGQFLWTLPESLRLFGANDGWTKVFTDDLAFLGNTVEPVGGKAHERFGIDKERGNVAILIRPDGYVACLANLNELSNTVEPYLETVLQPPTSPSKAL